MGIILILCIFAGAYYYFQVRAGVKTNVSLTDSLGEGLAGYWKLDDGSGTSATDSSTNGNTGTLTNGPTWTTGQIGGAVNFDGTNDYISLPSTINVSTLGAWSAWFKTSSSGNNEIIGKDKFNGPTNSNHRVALISGQVVFYDGTNDVAAYTLTSPSTYNDGNWHHMTATWGMGAKLYVDGVVVASSTSNAADNSGTYISIGRNNNEGNTPTWYFNGQIDEARIYNRVLSSDEVGSLYRLTSPTGVDTNLKGYWSFDGNDLSGTTAIDRSGAGNNGTLTNSPTVTQGKVGQALNFDGGDDYTIIPDADASLDIYATDDLTITGWFYRNTFTTDDTVIAKRNGQSSTSSGYLVWIDDATDKLTFEVSDATDEYMLESTTTFVAGEWNYFSIVWDQDSPVNSEIYINGIANDATDTGTIGNVDGLNNAANLVIGAESDAGSPFDGKLDEIRIYKTALSAAQIKSLYDQGQSDEKNTGKSQPQGTGNLDSGLAGYWKLDDGSGTSAADASTNGNTGTLTNGPTWTTGQIGGAVSFDGSNDCIDVGTTSQFQFANTSFTVTGWFKSGPSDTGGVFMAQGGAIGVGGWYVGLQPSTAGQLVGTIKNTDSQQSSKVQTTGGMNDNQWHHFAVIITTNTSTYTGNNIVIYADGTARPVTSNSDSTSGGYQIPSVSAKIGTRNNCSDTFFKGSLDEVRVYNRVLSSDEVSNLYRLTAPTGTDTSLKGYWSFNGKDLSGTTAYDRSGAGNNASSANGATITSGKVGQAASLDGNNDYYTIGGSGVNKISPLINGASAATISVWMKPSAYPSAGNSKRVFEGEIQNATAGVFLELYDSSGNIRVGGRSTTGDSFQSTTFPYPALNEWHLTTGVIDYANDTIYIYLDGILVKTTAVTFTSSVYVSGTPTTSIDTIGSNIGVGSYFSGALDEVRIYNTALSAAQIKALYDQGQADETNTGKSQPQGTGNLDSGLAGYWKLDDGSGTSAADTSTNGNTGTLTNGPTWGTGQVGGAVTLDGTNDDIRIADSAAFDVGGAGSWCLRFYPTANASSTALFMHDAASGRGFTSYKWIGAYLTSASAQLATYVRIGGVAYTTAETAHGTGYYNNAWHHVCSTFNKQLPSNRLKLYIDGVLTSQADATNGDIDAGGYPVLGAWEDNAAYFTGSLDDVRMYNRDLSADEVAQLYRLVSPSGTDTSLKGYWSFNGKDVSGTTAYDRSGAGNTGTLTNGPTVTPGKIGQALSFDGTNDYVSVPTAASLRPSLPLSFSFWVKPTTVSTAQGIFGMREAVQHDGYWSAIGSDGSLAISYGDGTACDPAGRRTKVTAASALVANQWQHVVGIIRGATDMTIYINGVDVGGTYSGTGGTISYVFTSILRLGSHGGSSGCGAAYLNGSLDEVRFFNTALSAAQVQSLYNAGK